MKKTAKATEKHTGRLALLLPLLIAAALLYIGGTAMTFLYYERIHLAFHLLFGIVGIGAGLLLYFKGFKFLKSFYHHDFLFIIILVGVAILPVLTGNESTADKTAVNSAFPLILAVFCAALTRLESKYPVVADFLPYAASGALFLLLCTGIYTEAALMTAIIFPLTAFYAFGRKIIRKSAINTLLAVILWIYSAICFVKVIPTAGASFERHFLCADNYLGSGWAGNWARDLVGSSAFTGPGGELDPTHYLSNQAYLAFARRSDTQLALASYDFGLIVLIAAGILCAVLLVTIIAALCTNRRRVKNLLLPDLLIFSLGLFFAFRIAAAFLLNTGIIFNFSYSLPFAGSSPITIFFDFAALGLLCSCIAAKCRIAEAYDKRYDVHSTPADRAERLARKAAAQLLQAHEYDRKAKSFASLSARMTAKSRLHERNAAELEAEARCLRSARSTADDKQKITAPGVNLETIFAMGDDNNTIVKDNVVTKTILQLTDSSITFLGMASDCTCIICNESQLSDADRDELWQVIAALTELNSSRREAGDDTPLGLVDMLRLCVKNSSDKVDSNDDCTDTENTAAIAADDAEEAGADDTDDADDTFDISDYEDIDSFLEQVFDTPARPSVANTMKSLSAAAAALSAEYDCLAEDETSDDSTDDSAGDTDTES